ncbi:glyoxalase/bleomycin resistance protein [Legionella birminghamensis]|uniref:Glyoxalase/bleomycin resistance protein n=1 Tax=Legionella birminghamensis TaxID=28083 RepID=A0A378ICS9_9GAMM|nr:VOC family protein [Legionella birminghamensis]KTC74320.1 glyoxalase/bleomycin resistance protein [Legionella birminghamensis]STX32562.1 glyoxalase/bleomycin resistance protein [Legionella birminghamensis]
MDKIRAGEFCWNELATPDVKAAKEFYSKLLGWQFTEHDTGDMIYTFINTQAKGEEAIGGIWGIPKERNEIPPHWMSYIAVDNVAETLKQATDLGATVKMPVTPVGNIGLFAIIADPTGAHIAFWEYK